MSSASASIAAWQRHAVVHPGSSGAQRVKTTSFSSTRADWRGLFDACRLARGNCSVLRLRHWFALYFSTFVRKCGLTRIRLDVLELRFEVGEATPHLSTTC